MPDGFVNLLKPPGLTSHDLVAFARRCLGLSRVGHLGTLDPAAAGVLPIAVGRATRLFDFAEGRKAYRAEIRFGLTTDTLDAEGTIASRKDASEVTAYALRAELAARLGQQEQIPPSFSAAQVGGKRLHALARRGQQVVAPARTVWFYALDLVDFRTGSEARAIVDVECSAGTYIRVLAQDLGASVGCGAYLAFLLRTRAGCFALEDAMTVEEAAARLPGGLLPPDWPLAHLPRLSLRAGRAAAFVSGTSVLVDEAPAKPVRVYDERGLFLGLGEVLNSGQLRPRLTLVSPEEVRA